MDREYATNYIPLVTAWLKGERPANMNNGSPREELSDRNAIKLLVPVNGTYQISEYGGLSKPENAPFGSVAVIDIVGAITKYDQDCGPAGMQTKSSLLDRCYNNPNIKGVVLNIDSGGGEGGAMRLMNETISRRNKPVYAFINDFACSAAYGIASGCDKIVANSTTARIGSIGTYLTIADFTEYYAKMGIKLIEVYASASVDKNKDYMDAIGGNTAGLLKIANQFNGMFIDMIQANRDQALTADKKEWGTGKVYFAEDALKIGLIDSIDSFQNCVSDLDNANINNQTSIQMKKQPINVNQLLKVENLEANGEGVYLNEDQVHTIDARLGELADTNGTLQTERDTATENAATLQSTVNSQATEIASLKTQIDNLKKGAGAVTQSVTQQTDENVEESATEGLFETISAARKIFSEIPD